MVCLVPELDRPIRPNELPGATPSCAVSPGRISTFSSHALELLSDSPGQQPPRDAMQHWLCSSDDDLDASPCSSSQHEMLELGGAEGDGTGGGWEEIRGDSRPRGMPPHEPLSGPSTSGREAAPMGRQYSQPPTTNGE